MSRRLKVAVVGCGNIARRAHVPAWMADGRADVVALCDPVEAAAREITSRTNIPARWYSDLGQLLAMERPNVVDVCSPTPFHFAHAKQALDAGCHVLLEKPPAESLAEAQELERLARAKQLKLGVSLNYRYRDLMMRLRELRDEGTLGRIVKVHITHHGPLVFTDAEWLWNEKKSRYLLWEFGIHFLDVLVFLLGEPEKVVSVLPVVDRNVGHTTEIETTIEFAGGARGRLEIVADSTRHSSFFTTIAVYGTAGDAFARWFPASVQVVSGQVNPISILFSEIRAIIDIVWKLGTGKFLTHRNISHHRLIADYADWVIDDKPFPIPMSEALKTFTLVNEVAMRVPSYGLAPGHVSAPEPASAVLV